MSEKRIVSRKELEIMAPAGSYEALYAAINAGADAVYFGAGLLNMRSNSSANFVVEDIQKIAAICSENNVKSYITLNTVIYDQDLETMEELLKTAKEAGVSAVIASDWAVIDFAHKIGLPVHCSTQLNISNSRALNYYSKYSDVIVLARELNLKQVRQIYDNILYNDIRSENGELVRIEMFIHGALCMSISGKCYLSLHEHNKSANRGMCLQPCRRGYTVIEREFGYELDIDNQYIMSPKDLCTIGFLDKIIQAGASVFKIEGRGRSPEYVKRTVECYNEALNIITSNIEEYTEERIKDWRIRLGEVFNRGFWDGYYLGQRLGEWSDRHGSSASKKKVLLGAATNYYSNLKVAEFLVQSGSVSVGEEILIIGPTTGVVETKIEEMHGDNGSISTASKGERFSIAVPVKIRKNDKIYRLISSEDEGTL